MMQSIRILFLTSISFLFIACSLLGPVKAPIEHTYLLSQKSKNIAKKYRGRSIILVLRPETAEAFDTSKMAYSIKPFQIAYYAKNRWVEKPKDMLQPLMVKTLHDMHRFKAVAAAPYTGNYDYALLTQIYNLNQNFIYRQPRFEFMIRAQILKSRTNRIIASKEFTIIVAMPIAAPYGGVLAGNQAVAKFLSDLSYFVARSV